MLNDRIESLLFLKEYMQSNAGAWQETKWQAERMNGWFTQEFIEHTCNQINTCYFDDKQLREFASEIEEKSNPKSVVGITMAGNIPLVGFHDFLCTFLSGHSQRIKFSSKDDVLLPHLIQKLYEHNEANRTLIQSGEMLKGCNAYIATGSNNSAQYFEQYFAKYPHIIRKNRTSVAVLTGNETDSELENLADDVYLYFGLGCRNVTKIYVPKDFQFEKLLQVFRKYNELKNHNKYRNNLDYNLALFILNNQYYMSNDSILLSENTHLHSPIAVLNYEFYESGTMPDFSVHQNDIQAIISKQHINFGDAQKPNLHDFADGVNTLSFLQSLA